MNSLTYIYMIIVIIIGGGDTGENAWVPANKPDSGGATWGFMGERLSQAIPCVP